MELFRKILPLAILLIDRIMETYVKNELPQGWKELKIKDICHLINGRAFKPTEWSSEGLPIIRIQNLNDVNASFNYCNFEVENEFIVTQV